MKFYVSGISINRTAAVCALTLIMMTLLAAPAFSSGGLDSDLLDFEIPGPARVILVLVGIALLCIGYYIYEFLIALPGFILGAAIGAALTHNQSGVVTFLVVVVLGLVGAGIALLLHKIAIFLGGALVGGSLLAVVLMAITKGEPNVVAAIIGGIIGGIVALAIHRFMIIVISSFIGALAIIGGLKSESVVLFVILMIVGIIIQSGMSRVLKRQDKEEVATSAP